MAGPLSHQESAQTLALTGFYCFSGLHYIEDGPYLLCTLQKTKGRMLLITQKGRIFANVKGKVVELVTLILGRFSIDFRKFL